MLVTHTCREIVSILPRFRVVAMSMKRLQISVARIAAISIEMIHLNPVVMLEDQPTNWLRVLGAAEMPHINHGVGHQFHTIVPTLDVLKPQQ